MESLDILLGEKYDDATFHDSELLSFNVDFARATVTLEFKIQCRATQPSEQFSLQRGTVQFSGVWFFSVEPTILEAKATGKSSLWIAADGPLPDDRLQISAIVPNDPPPEAFVHYLYSNSTNSYIVIGARGAAFSWAHSDLRNS